MKIQITRYNQSKRSTIGKMTLDNTFFCFTLEPPKETDPDGNGFVCIPEGTFPLTIRWSNEHKRQLPHVENVPGRSAIEIHIGNFPNDTKGCTLVGYTQDQDNFIGKSSVAFSDLISKLYAIATLRDINALEIDQIWDVGEITYMEGAT